MGCYDALLGNPKSAQVHLLTSFKMDPSFREIAKKDPDLESVRKLIRNCVFCRGSRVGCLVKDCRRHGCHYRFCECNLVRLNFANASNLSFKRISRNLASSAPPFPSGKTERSCWSFTAGLAMPVESSRGPKT